MNRDEARLLTFARDGGVCVFCEAPAVDAHHLLERRLWDDGGYHLDNLISVCEDHHLACEETTIPVSEGRLRAGIRKALVPDHLYDDVHYDKWGNIELEGTVGWRSPGELFLDPSVQKILREAGFMDMFTDYVKYPRTYHLPWSHANRDDRSWIEADVRHNFEGKCVIVTEKMDGENTTMYRDHIHARSIDGNAHKSQGWVRNFWSKIAYDIPSGYRICGENVYARHSIKYENLSTYFYGFSVWNMLECLSWDDTLEWFALLGIEPVPVLYRGIWREDIVKGGGDLLDLGSHEGYVVRLEDSFELKDFRRSVAKYVRPNHVQTPERWDNNIVPNGLAR